MSMQSVLQVGPKRNSTFVSATPNADFHTGWNLYANGYSVYQCDNAIQERGWKAAWKADSDAATDAYLATARCSTCPPGDGCRGVEDLEADHEWIRRGC